MIPVRSIGRLCVLALTWTIATRADAQIISPGRLSRVHADLEGITNCTSCHELGRKGIQNTRCLDCHEPLQQRIREGRGLHAASADETCASCHKEHFGAVFEMVRFDTTRFDHADAGFELLGRHADESCRSCHRPELVRDPLVRAFKGKVGALDDTFLGLSRSCIDCHATDDPHERQFVGRDCAGCHSEEGWEDVGAFDHSEAAFALTGQHREVECAACHPTRRGPSGGDVVQFADVAFGACSDCHEDPHAGEMGARCSSCHTATGWYELERAGFERTFDHATTGFELVGRHARVACRSCHTSRSDESIRLTFQRAVGSYRPPDAEDCNSCHVDIHRDAFDASSCDDCHTQESWQPVSFDIERHNVEADFMLTGAHVATPCRACHSDAEAFRFESFECTACHAADDPHGSQFGDTACTACHGDDAWNVPASFDHDATEFPLDGAHVDVLCADCHVKTGDVRTFRGLDESCASCHDAVDPHQKQFADRACSECHDTASFRLASFDHDATRFPLDGAHESVPCSACHRQEESAAEMFTRFKPMGTACGDCHDSE